MGGADWVLEGERFKQRTIPRFDPLRNCQMPENEAKDVKFICMVDSVELRPAEIQKQKMHIDYH